MATAVIAKQSGRMELDTVGDLVEKLGGKEREMMKSRSINRKGMNLELDSLGCESLSTTHWF